MGRKIPGKKHRTVKDPEVQRNKRYAAIKNKINNPPKNIDEQEIPKSVLRIMELKELAKKQMERKRGGKRRDKRKKDRFDVKRALGKEIKMPGMDRPDQYMPEIEQGPNEPVEKFTQRVQHVCNDLLKEVQYEEKYGVEIKRNETGQITQIKSEKRSKKPKLSEKRKNRVISKMAGQEPVKDFAKVDRIQFGDIVHQPPTKLTIPKSKTSGEKISRKPGTGNLLLKNLLPNQQNLEKQRQEERRKLVVEAFRKTKKLKNVS